MSGGNIFDMGNAGKLFVDDSGKITHVPWKVEKMFEVTRYHRIRVTNHYRDGYKIEDLVCVNDSIHGDRVCDRASVDAEIRKAKSRVFHWYVLNVLDAELDSVKFTMEITVEREDGK